MALQDGIFAMHVAGEWNKRCFYNAGRWAFDQIIIIRLIHTVKLLAVMFTMATVSQRLPWLPMNVDMLYNMPVLILS